MTSDGNHLGYIVSHEAWYGPQQYPDHGSISIGRFGDIGVWEFTIEQGKGHPQLVRSAEIRMWGDSWQAFIEVPDLFRDLAGVVEGADGVSLDAVRKVLDAHGFRDDTPRKSPYADDGYPACGVCGKRAVDGSDPPLCPPHRAEVDGWLRERRVKG